ncbi:DNA mismatch repair protein MutS [Halegenticoccus tardaugens]|uniref:DNA mismatch repair protein MutS n=1 Tax=Halegenticoccus tardaugens TaxID=2071624 RepID=UPI00100AFAC3|nr:DNA mismatch repair protein MutS [Halegenticoccus tardaugens]
MATVTGPPERMTEVRDELTPMLSQYYDLCAAYDDSLLLFQVGDFYEAFCEAAEETARVCEITLTKREDSTGTYPMAGIPIDNAAKYIERLLDAGYRVAVAEQVEDPEEASGLVDRAVTQIVTPGTVVEDELLRAGSTNYVAALASDPDDGRDDEHVDDRAASAHAVAAVDVSTGECLVTSVGDRDRLAEEVERLQPAELLRAPEMADFPVDALDVDAMETDYDPEAFARDVAGERVAAYAPNPDAVVENAAELRAVGAALAYAEYTQGGERLAYVSRITRYDPRESLRLDATALRSLELFETRGHGAGRALVDVLDDTSCALGRRLLSRWLRRPLVDRDRIEARHDAVEEFAARSLVREAVRDHLTDVYDVERLVGRVSRGRANARDLRALKTTLDVVPDVKAALDEVESDALRDLRGALDEMADVRDLIGRAIRPEPPIEITEGDVIREGFDEELDGLRATEREGREWVAELEERERERTGIDSLDVGYNQVHGYYIEVTNPNLDAVPDDYTRRQTLKNSERFYTPELKRREDEILGAAERADALEYELFCEVRAAVADEAERVQALADALAALDVLATLAAVAVANDYARPAFAEDGIRVEAGRHPVVERTRPSFVPNDADLGPGEVAIITGPNMSGKSTYMRQIALIVVLAQAGSFVPADAASLPIVDRVFTRVGASDDIAGGQSTFMREMSELTDILHGATEDSLVLLDEVGRGTSTADGLAIARATSEFLHDEIGAYALFATHYHELTDLAGERERVRNLHFAASGDGESVTFLHRVDEGASSSSYGVEVARMAGVPESVVGRSRELVAAREAADATRSAASDARTRDAPTADARSAEAPTADATPPAPRDARQTTLTNGSRPAADDGEETARAGGETGIPARDLRSTDGKHDGALDPARAGERADDRLDADALASVAAELRSLDVARTTPLEALNALNELKRRLDDG